MIWISTCSCLFLFSLLISSLLSFWHSFCLFSWKTELIDGFSFAFLSLIFKLIDFIVVVIIIILNDGLIGHSTDDLCVRVCLVNYPYSLLLLQSIRFVIVFQPMHDSFIMGERDGLSFSLNRYFSLFCTSLPLYTYGTTDLSFQLRSLLDFLAQIACCPRR